MATYGNSVAARVGGWVVRVGCEPYAVDLEIIGESSCEYIYLGCL